jgi:regulatory protein
LAAKVTDIKPVEPGSSRLTVFIDGEAAFTVSEPVARDLGLRVGAELADGDARRVHAEEERTGVREAALGLLAVRARSRGELTYSLTRRGFPREAVESVVDALSEVGLVDDEAFARAWAEERARLRPVGPRRLRGELMARHVAAGLASRIVEEFFAGSSELELARRAVAPKLRARTLGGGAGEDVRRRRRRLFAFLVRRGFSYEVASQVVDELDSEGSASVGHEPEGEPDV